MRSSSSSGYSCPTAIRSSLCSTPGSRPRPRDLVVRRVPVAFNASFVPQQSCTTRWKAWASSTLCTPRCSAPSTWKSQAGQGRRHFAWVGNQGVDAAKFKEVYNSFTVNNQARRRAAQLQGEYGVERAFHGRGRPLLH